MKLILLLIPALCLTACADQQHTSSNDPAPGTDQSTYAEFVRDSQTVREPSRVHTYIVNDYVDPNNPRLLHRGHLVDVVEQDEKWNLTPTNTTEANLGPVTAVNDPNAAPNPYSAEFETELAQQRDQYHQLAEIGTQMTAAMGKLQEMAEKSADAVSENAALRDRLDELQREIDEMKPPPSPPATSNTAPKKLSWFDSIWNLFQPAPEEMPAAEDKPELRTNVVLRPVEPSSPAPPVSTIPPVPSTNAPGVTPLDPALPAPGEMSQSHDESSSQP